MWFPRFSWRYQLREFKSEFRVVAVDMRGYGESDVPLSVESYRFEHLVTDVRDIVEYLGEPLGLNQPLFKTWSTTTHTFPQSTRRRLKIQDSRLFIVIYVAIMKAVAGNEILV